jgi:hypothetical protein
MDHSTAQWIHDVSAVTTNAQLAGCSTRSHRHPPYDDVDGGSLSPRHPRQSQISMRDLTPDGSESSCQLNEADSSPIDEEADSLESPGPDDLDEPWPYTFRVNAIHPLQGMDADNCFRWEIMYGYEQRKGTGIRAECRAIMSNEGRLDRYWFSLYPR